MGDAVMRSSLAAIFSSPSGAAAAPGADGAAQQQEGARKLLADAASAGDVAAASAWVQFVLSDAVPLVASRALVSEAPEALSAGFADPRKRAEALSSALELLHPQRAASLEASSGALSAGLRRALAAAHEACEEWGAAARALAGIDVESVGAAAAAAAAAAGPGGGAEQGAAKPPPPPPPATLLSLAPATAEKLRHCVRVAMLFLEDEDAGSAEVYVKKGAPFAASLTSAAAEARRAAAAAASPSSRSFDEAAATADLGLELQYRSCAARVLDARRDFTRAAAAYATLSRARDGALGGGARAPPELVSDADLDAALSAAVTCAVLAPPGPARTRILAGLGRDERAARLPLSGVLEAVRSQRLLTRDDARALDAALTMPHHRAVGGDGATVLERALREHNLSAAARVYSALTLEALGELLGLSGKGSEEAKGGRQKSAAEEAEAMAAKMVSEGRLRATIDQVDGIITFEEEEVQAGGGGGGGGGAGGGGGGGEGGDGGEGDDDDAAVAALCEGLDVVAAAVAVG